MIDGNKSPILIFALITVIATGALAGTIDSVATPNEGDEGFEFEQNPDEVDIGDPEGPDINDSGDGSTDLGGRTTVDLVFCVEFLTKPTGILAVLSGLVLILLGTYSRFNLAATVIAGTFVVPFVWISYFFFTNCATGSSTDGSGVFEGMGSVSDPGGVVATPTASPLLIAVVFGLVVLGAIALLVSASGEEEIAEPAEEDVEEPDRADFARAAGRAADRIEEEHVPVDNAVYRAWLDMTNLLNIPNPETSTPRGFADAAIEFGLDRDDVTELTELFNEVRYGDRDASVREERALEILRNIEETYDSVDASGKTDGDGDEPDGGEN